MQKKQLFLTLIISLLSMHEMILGGKRGHTGPQGVQGPPGLAGAQGPQGAPGYSPSGKEQIIQHLAVTAVTTTAAWTWDKVSGAAELRLAEEQKRQLEEDQAKSDRKDHADKIKQLEQIIEQLQKTTEQAEKTTKENFRTTNDAIRNTQSRLSQFAKAMEHNGELDRKTAEERYQALATGQNHVTEQLESFTEEQNNLTVMLTSQSEALSFLLQFACAQQNNNQRSLPSQNQLQQFGASPRAIVVNEDDDDEVSNLSSKREQNTLSVGCNPDTKEQNPSNTIASKK